MTPGAGLHRWALDPDDLAGHACELVGRELTADEWHDVLPERQPRAVCS